MLMAAEPVYLAYELLRKKDRASAKGYLSDSSGKVLTM